MVIYSLTCGYLISCVLVRTGRELEEVVHLLNTDEQNRTTTATTVNVYSSLSHSVFTISLEVSNEETDNSTGSSRVDTVVTDTSWELHYLTKTNFSFVVGNYITF